MAGDTIVCHQKLDAPSRRRIARRCEPLRKLFGMVIMLICLALLVRTFLLDTYHVPTGSMAPALLGDHRACTCPRCGFPVEVGLHQRDNGAAAAQASWYRQAWCPNCGATGLPLHLAPTEGGQRLLVDKTAFAIRTPRRWEIAVFHLFGLDFIKRILGLPDESIEIKGGDLYVDGELCRKTLAEFKAMRILVFDNNYQPQPMTWAARWENASGSQPSQLAAGTSLLLDGTHSWHLAAYRHFCLETGKCLPIADEYGYNGAEPCRSVPVHDVMLDCEVEIKEGQGSLALGITDSKDHVIVKLPVGGQAPSATLHAAPGFSLPVLQNLGPALTEAAGVLLQPGKRYHVEWAFVDRRVMLAIDGQMVFAPFDLPACETRLPLLRPVMLAVSGVKATATNIRLYRDVHYTQDGKNGVGGALVRLGPDQYFVMGDNSPRSEDSRFWPNDGAVPGSAMVGSPLLVLRPGWR